MPDVRWRDWLTQARPSAAAYAASIQNLPQDIAGMEGAITGCSIYPIKGLGALDVPEMLVAGTGLKTADGKIADRGLMLAIRLEQKQQVDGVFYGYKRFSQRDTPCLALAMPSYNGHIVSYNADGMDTLHIYPEQMLPSRKGATVMVKMYDEGNDVLPASIEDGPITPWVRSFLARSKVKVDPNSVVVLCPMLHYQRGIEKMHARKTCGSMQFTDGGYGLAVSSSTVIWMNGLIKETRGIDFRGIKAGAFRPNIVLDGLPPNAEDLVDTLQFEGGHSMLFGGLCVRCSVTMIDPKTGVAPDAEPLAFLAKQRPPRPDKLNKTTFGVNWVSDSEGWHIRCGQSFAVASEKQMITV